MKTYILKETNIDKFYDNAIRDFTCVNAVKIKLAIMGMDEIELDEAKKKAEIGDCLVLEYDGKLLPFQVLHKRANGNVVLSSYYVLDNHIFDEKTNVWRDSDIRRFMNNDMLKKFDPAFQALIKSVDVHTDDYVTRDKLYLLSHEEIGYVDTNGMFKKNVGTETFDYYKRTTESDGQ